MLILNWRIVRLTDLTSSCKKVAVVLSPGSEELEFVTIVDVLRRGGVTVHAAGLNGKYPHKCQRDFVIIPDTDLASTKAEDYDGIVLPGGVVGSNAMIASKELGKVLKDFENKNKVIGAISAAPTALAAHSIALGKNLTSYPAMKKELVHKYIYDDTSKVVVDGNLVTSRSPATAIYFAVKLVEVFVNKDKAEEVAKAMLLDWSSC